MASVQGFILEICFLLSVILFSSVDSKAPFLDFTCVANQSLIRSSDNTSHVTISVRTPISNASFFLLDGQTTDSLRSSREGTFDCSLNHEIYEAKTTVIISTKDATFYPPRVTVTTDPLDDNANITLCMTARSSICKGQRRWRELGSPSAGIKANEANLILTNEDVANRSSVVFHHFFKDCKKQKGYVQLLLRECPSGKWSPQSESLECDRDCDVCLNGGMCHPRTGKCICPPGFNGTNCQNVHGRNVFGQMAQYRCNETGDPHDPGCRGKLFCLPEPFGCTCAAGYSGINCSEECDPGSFGANCEQQCHCTTNLTCLADTGECEGSSCLPGWMGPNCQEATYLVSLRFSDVNINQTTNITCSVSNKAPSNETDFALVLPDGSSMNADYVIEYENPDFLTEYMYIFTTVADFTEAEYTCTDTQMTVNATIIVKTHVPPQLSRPPTVTESTSSTVTLTWDPWNTDTNTTGEGPVVKYIITYRELDGISDDVTAGETPGETTSFEVQDLKEATSYEFWVSAARPGEGGVGAPSPSTIGKTSCGVPGKATEFRVLPVNATSLALFWSPPINTTCPDITYCIWLKKRVRCPSKKWEKKFSEKGETRGQSYVIGQLQPDTLYKVRLISKTEAGEKKLTLAKKTNESVPGPPVFLSTESTSTNLTFTWEKPDCKNENGNILGYHFQLLDADMELQNEGVLSSLPPLKASFKNLTPCTNYTFRVRGWTAEGNGTFSDDVIVLTKNGQPDAVKNLTTYAGEKSFRVEWEPPDDSPCDIIGYTLTYKLLRQLACSEDEEMNETQVSVMEPFYNVTDLLPYSEYQVYVVALTQAGPGPRQTTRVETEEDVPGHPNSIVVSHKTSDSLAFAWAPPDCTQRNGLITGYQTTLRNASEIVATSNTEETNATFDDLPACATFTFEVTAETTAGWGEPSQVCDITTENEEPDAVKNLMTYPDKRSFRVEWKPPYDSPCDIIGYNLTYKLLRQLACSEEEEMNEIEVSTSDPFYNVMDLLPYSEYQVSVVALTQAGPGPKQTKIVEMLQDVPSSPVSINNTHATPTSLTFVWEPSICENRNGEIIGFRYQLEDTETNIMTNGTTDDDDDESTVTVGTLKPCTQYRFRVQAQTRAGYGSFSNELPASTLSQAPGTVGNLLVLTINSTSLQLSWTQPVNTTCQIANYSITYKLLKYLQCPGNKTSSSESVIVGSTPSYLITGLSPASRYAVSVKAGTSGKFGLEQTVSGETSEAVPGPVLNVSAVFVGQFSAKFSWYPPLCQNRHSIIVGYSWILSHQESSETEEVTTPDTNATVQSLLPCTNYIFSVYARTNKGLGQETRVPFRTDPAEPEKVNGLTNVKLNSTKAKISWSPPASETNPCPIQQYRVVYQLVNIKECGRGTNETLFVTTNNTRIRLGSLRPFSSYKVLVAARTAAGFGMSLEHEFDTKRDVPSSPVAVNNTHGTSTSLTFVWKLPACENRNGEIQMFNYQLKDMANKTVKNDTTDSENTMVTVEGLKSCTRYEFKVRARTAKGYGSFSTPLFASTHDQAPDAVRNLEVIPLNSTSVQLTWTKPGDTTCPITEYAISYTLTKYLQCYENLTASVLLMRSVNAESGSSYIISGLSPASRYAVSVMAGTIGGFGVKRTVNGETLEAAPTGPPHYITANATGPTFLHFNWQPPPCHQQNGQIISYTYFLNSAINETVDVGETTTTNVLIRDLYPFQEYHFTMWANTKFGSGPSGRLFARTSEAAPPQPTDVMIVSAGKYSLELKWSRPDPPSGNVSAYQIEYWQQGLDENSAVSKETLADPTNQQHRYRISDLHPFTIYFVRVRGRTGAGYGDWSENITGLTQQAAPEKPASADVTERTESSITIQWQAPKVLNGELTGYKIEYKVIDLSLGPVSGDESSESEVIAVSNLVSTHKLKELRPATGYEIRIAAVTLETGEYETVRPSYTKIPVIDEKPTMPAQPFLSEDNIVTIQLQPISSPYVSVYQVTVTAKPSSRKRDTNSVAATSYQQSQEYYIAAEFDKSDIPQKFQVGDNKTYGVYYNAPLKYDTNYDLQLCGVGRTKQDTQRSCSDPSSVKTNPLSSGPGVEAVLGAVIAVLAVIALLLVVMVIVRKRQRSAKSEYSDNGVVLSNLEKAQGQANGLQNQNQTVMEEIVRTQLRRSGGVKGASTTPAPKNAKALPPKAWKPHKPIGLLELPGYVKRKKADGNKGFIKDYASFPSDQLYSCDAACKEANKNKNRYANILPYDYSRVVLDTINDDPDTDYVNASFIDGYKKKNAYIATQGHNKYSIPDFWRMVWQQEVAIIVMLTNLVENAKKKCTCYWPENQHSYDNIVVKLASERVEQDFTERVFIIANVCIDEDIPREVRQFHYTTWPDMGLPDSPAPIMNFIHEVKQAEEENTGPMVVHCSAGVGRTGTFITVDSMLNMVVQERQINVIDFVYEMRKKRPKMVQTQDQYMFIFEVLLETLLCGETVMNIKTFPDQYEAMQHQNPLTGNSYIEEHFRVLDAMSVMPSNNNCHGARNELNLDKNRYTDCIPLDRSRPYLMSPGDENGTNYINASFMDSYKKKDGFLATQSPLPNTVIDFWRMVYDYNARVVVMLNQIDGSDETCAPYWTDDPEEIALYGIFEVQLRDCKSFKHTVARTFKLKNTSKDSEKPRTIHHFAFHDWAEEEVVPSSLTAFLGFLELVESGQQQAATDGRVAVHCLDGVSRSGLFCASMASLQKLKEEKVIDVFHAVRNLRRNRHSMVDTQDQYLFIYEILDTYLDENQTYANFR